MKRHAILHIGPMKTGSTSIQSWLRGQAASLAAHGYHVPASLGENMSALAHHAQARASGKELSEVESARLAALGAEVRALPDSVHTIVISAEMLGQHLSDAADLQALKDILAESCDRYIVVAYLRRQDRLSISRYSTALRRGDKRARPLAGRFDFDHMLGLWADAFGRENVRPRLFDRSAMPGGDVVRDFAMTTGLPWAETDQPVIVNSSLIPEAQTFLAALAKRLREAGYPEPLSTVTGHDNIVRILGSAHGGKGLMPLRSEVLAYYAEVRAGNERVRQAWFPDRATLFDEDFSEYPEGAPRPIPPRKVLDVAMNVIVELITTTQLAQRTQMSGDDHSARSDIGEIRREKRRRRQDGNARPKRGKRRRGADAS